jgi:hypothetical protein
MKKRLIKNNGDYFISNEDGTTFATTNFFIHKHTQSHRLSLKNCQIIELGYDIEKLVESNINQCNFDSYSDYITAKTEWEKGFKKGFDLVRENNKKENSELIDSMCMRYRHDFELIRNEEEKDILRTTMRQVWEEVVGLGFYDGPTEWSVEVEVGVCGDQVYEVPEIIIDDNGCIILHKI